MQVIDRGSGGFSVVADLSQDIRKEWMFRTIDECAQKIVLYRTLMEQSSCEQEKACFLEEIRVLISALDVQFGIKVTL